ncbi:polysaccharide export protein [Lichenibacterium minor]|uniref:Polysaccharide export protein n=1 Tax=Lichenibacterium minor TaxID=2316528 RepID=A0A4Q2U2N7_9HYPH|nr:polysaccharide biosynthesis/export family protein [Lichenibacterium minor]RYC30753.1 polysaccharide export protein [Lichenibacterium minor]
MSSRSAAAVGCALLLGAATLSGCSELPSAAPTAVEFIAPGAVSGNPGYVLLDLDPTVAKAISSYRRAGLSSLGADVYRPSLVLKPGDVVAVTVFEVAPIPLFGAAPALNGPADKGAPVGGHTATLPAQVVEQDGTVPVPFGGTVKVAGLTPAQAGRAIARSLDGKATNPQVLVSLVSSTVNTASVNGDVGKPGLVPITLRGERVLDVIAEAGGPRDPPFDTDVQLVRGGRVARATMQRLVEDPRENIRIEPGDNLVLIRNPRSFSVLGAALKVSQYDFNVERVTLAEGVARAGGGNDAIANVGQIFLMRFEPPALVRTLLPPGDPRLTALAGKVEPVPVVYHLDLRAASGYFIGQSVQMRDKDTVLITNADAVELSKAVQIMRGIAGIYYDFRGPVTTTTTTARRVITSTSDGGGGE